jgi:hypothetical protein
VRPDRRSQTGASGSRFQFARGFAVTGILAVALFVTSQASDAEYEDTGGTFTISFDDTIWTIKSGDDGDFSVDCASGACAGNVAGCSGSRMWVPFASVGRLTREFDAKETERAVLDGLAKEKAAREKGKTPGPDDFPPTVVKPYTLKHSRSGQPFHESEYRVSFDGPLTRFLSFSTGARSHSIAIVCHVPEERLSEWRPRIDALIEGFRPAPDPFWLRWLGFIGL